MRVLIFGVSDMVGQAVLRESLRAPDVSEVVGVGRTRAAIQSPQFREILTPDLFDIEAYGSELVGLDACFFCLGVSSAGMNEADYTRLTFDLTLTIAKALTASNPDMTFVYVSGAGTDSSETGRVMWARVKGRTENALLRLPFKGAYLFRPAAIVPMNGETSKVTSYRRLYSMTATFSRRRMSVGACCG